MICTTFAHHNSVAVNRTRDAFDVDLPRLGVHGNSMNLDSHVCSTLIEGRMRGNGHNPTRAGHQKFREDWTKHTSRAR